MKKILLIILLSIFSLNISCKDKEEKPSREIIKEELNTPKNLTINFSFKTNKADTFTIMLNNIKVDELQKKNIHIFEDVIASTGEDSILAEFDSDNISNNLIFSIGNKEVKELEIKSILILYGKKQFNISTPEDLNKYIIFNDFIVRDSTSLVLKTKKINGRHNPTFRIKNTLLNSLTKE